MGMAGETGDDGGVVLLQQTIELRGPCRDPHGNDGLGTQLRARRGDCLREREVLLHGGVAIDSRRNMVHDPDFFVRLFGLTKVGFQPGEKSWKLAAWYLLEKKTVFRTRMRTPGTPGRGTL